MRPAPLARSARPSITGSARTATRQSTAHSGRRRTGTNVSDEHQDDLAGFDVSARWLCWTTHDVYVFCHDRDAETSCVLAKIEDYTLIALSSTYAYLAQESGELVRVPY
jgi:hypothetical protein